MSIRQCSTVLTGAFLCMAVFATASVASADVRGDWATVAEALRSAGLSDSAAQIEAAVAALSDEELERVYGNADLAGLAEAFSSSADALSSADQITGGIASQQAQAAGGFSKSTAGFPDAVGYPSSSLCPFSPDRSNADDLLIAVDAIEAARIALEAAKVIWSGLSRACGETIVILGEGGNTELACIPADVVLFAAELVVGLAEGVVEHIAFCDAAVDAAEIEGSYERLGHLHTDWTSKFPGVATVSRRGHGCNGIDDNASGVIDECGEDTYAPAVHIDAAVGSPWYRSLAEASAAVARAFFAIDECQTTSEAAPVLGGSCKAVTASVTANDACGNAATAHTVVQVDGTPPSIVIDPAVKNRCVINVEQGEQAVLAATTLGDDCTPVPELDFRLDSTVSECSLRVREEAIDHAGNRTVNAVTVRSDSERPVVEIERLLLGFRGAVLGFQTPLCYDTVAAAEAEVLEVARMQDNCSAAANIDRSVSSSGDACNLLVTARGVDECDNANTDAVTVRVDPQPPTVTAAVAVDQLSPANHEMIDVGFSFTASDNCSGELEVTHTVTSDEPTAHASGAGQTSHAPDAEILRDLDGTVRGIRLRAERSTSGDGRVYEITVKAMDPCGNVASASATVSVPQRRGGAAVDSGQFYDATAVN